MWEFASGLLLLSLTGGTSLRLTAALTLATMVSAFFFGSSVGAAIDRAGNLKGPLVALALQNLAIALAAGSAWLAFQLPPDDPQRGAVITGIIVFGCFARLASIGSTLSVEKRWATALCAGDSDALAQLNGRMRCLDLSCKILAPAATGSVMSAVSPMAAAALVAAANIVAWPIEAGCLVAVYRDPTCHASLEAPRKKAISSAGPEKDADGSKGPWRTYFGQDIWPSAFALSLLHLTVLSFGQVMTAYLVTLNVSTAVVALCRGAGEVFGLMATALAPRAVAARGPVRAATVFIWMQWSMLAACVVGASSWARAWPPAVPVALLVCGVGTSRLGLWGFDLSVTQLLQERVVPPSAIGAVGGTQKSLEAFFGSGAALASTLLADPSQFQYLAFASWASVTTAALVHTIAARRASS